VIMNRSTIFAYIVFAVAATTSLSCPARDGMRSECVGDFTIQLEGDIEYALVPAQRLASIDATATPQTRFSDGLWVQGSRIDVDIDGLGPVKLFQSASASRRDLMSLAEILNATLAHRKQAFLDDARWLDEHPDAAKNIDPDRRERASLLSKADKVGQFVGASGYADTVVGPAEATPEVLSLVGDHIYAAKTSRGGSQARLVEILGSLVKRRNTFDVPAGRGLCVPGALLANDLGSGEVAVNLKMKNQPDIVVFFEQSDAAEPRQSAKEFISAATQPGRTFVGSVESKPLDRIRPTHALRIDGRDGLGAFAQVRREGALANTADKDLDLAFIGYVPGQAGLKPGRSYDITLKVERFGRFAREPMSEAEFRALVEKLTTGIKRRDGS
jgi:hypothetical protein